MTMHLFGTILTPQAVAPITVANPKGLYPRYKK